MTALSSSDPIALLDPLRPLVDDWHTHRPLTPRAIINLPSPLAPAPPGYLYSIGLHPWDIEELRVERIERLERAGRIERIERGENTANDGQDLSPLSQSLISPNSPISPLSQSLISYLDLIEARAAADPSIVAIGEAGLDRLRGPALPLQAQVFEVQALIAERQRLPLIIHSVRTIPEILAIHRRLRPTVPWIFHGFRGRPEAAVQILRRPGTLISLGPLPASRGVASGTPAPESAMEPTAEPSASRGVASGTPAPESAMEPTAEPSASRGVASGTPALESATMPSAESAARAALLAVIPPDRLLRETDAQ